MSIHAFPKHVQCWESEDLFSTILQSRGPQPAVEMVHAGCGEHTYYKLFCRRREAKPGYCSRKHKQQHAGKWSKSRKHVLRKQCSSTNEQEYAEAGKLSGAHQTCIEASVMIHGQDQLRPPKQALALPGLQFSDKLDFSQLKQESASSNPSNSWAYCSPMATKQSRHQLGSTGANSPGPQEGGNGALPQRTETRNQLSSTGQLCPSLAA